MSDLAPEPPLQASLEPAPALQTPAKPRRNRPSRALRPLVTHERLKELLHYDPETGVFRRLVRRFGAHEFPDTHDGRGYLQFCVDGRLYLAHRLAWLYVHGHWPPTEIDHKNRIRDDNRLANLRLATRSQNNWNKVRVAKSNSGHLGVYGLKNGSWCAVIAGRWLGTFWVREEAINRANDYRAEVAGEFAATG